MRAVSIDGTWQVKEYFRKTARTRWRRRYLKKALKPGRGTIIVRLILTAALTAEVIYGAGIVIRNPRPFFETLGIQVISETGKVWEWAVTGEETSWGLRIGPDGIQLYREEIGLYPKKATPVS